MKRIEVFFFAGCPGYPPTLAAAEAAARAGDDVTVASVEVGPDDVERLRFIGSPSVRVDDVDVEEGARDRRDYGMQCRVYAIDGKLQKHPPVSWIAAALAGTAPP